MTLIATPTEGTEFPHRLNNVITATENPEDERRVDIRFMFGITRADQKARIRKRIYDAFDGKLCSVRFATDHDLVVKVKPNGRGCPRFEIVDFAVNGFT